THEQAQLFLESLSLDWMRHICAFALSTGCRQGEILSLSWQSIDIEQKVAWIHSDLSKSGKARAVPLSDDALNVLHKRHGLHPEHVFKMEEHTSELQSRFDLVCRLLLEKKKHRNNS